MERSTFNCAFRWWGRIERRSSKVVMKVLNEEGICSTCILCNCRLNIYCMFIFSIACWCVIALVKDPSQDVYVFIQPNSNWTSYVCFFSFEDVILSNLVTFLPMFLMDSFEMNFSSFLNFPIVNFWSTRLVLFENRSLWSLQD